MKDERAMGAADIGEVHVTLDERCLMFHRWAKLGGQITID